jgi:hypothetical protein
MELKGLGISQRDRFLQVDASILCGENLTSRWSCRLEFHLIREDFVCCGSPGSMGLRLLWFCGFDSAAQLNSMLERPEILTSAFCTIEERQAGIA